MQPEKNKNAIEKSFLNGALILSVASILIKVIGAIYRIPLVRLIGGDGMGYYNDAYQIYSLLFVISTAGIPVAIAKLVSESNAIGRINEPKKILRLAIITFSIIGFIGMCVMYFGVDMFISLTKTPQSRLSIMAIAPAVFFVSLTSSFKGFFQGYKNMVPTAIYQIIEASAKLLGLVIVVILIHNGYKDNYAVLASGAVLGVTFGAFCSMLFMLFRFIFGKKEKIVIPQSRIQPNRKTSTIFKSMLAISIPVTFSSAVMSLTSFIDMVLVKNSLIAAGYTADTANFMYGSYTGCTSSLFNLPPTITLTVGVSILPFLSSYFSVNDKKSAFKNMHSSMKVVSLIAMPCTIGMSVMARPILTLLFSSKPEEVNIAAPTLRILALAIVFVSFVSLTNVFLQSAGKAYIPIITMIIGAVIKIIVNYNLVRIPAININGAPIGSLLCYSSIVIINIIFIYKITKFKMPIISVFIKPLICSIVCSAGAYLVYSLLFSQLKISNTISTLCGLFIAVIIYFITIFAIKAIDRDDILLLPKGDKIADFFAKLNLIK